MTSTATHPSVPSVSSQTSSSTSASPVVSTRSLAELIDELSRFDGPPEEFLTHLLAGQCEVGQACAGAILRQGEAKVCDVLAVYPAVDPEQELPDWLKQAMQQASRVCEQGLTLSLPVRSPQDVYEERASRYLVMVPLLGDAGVRGAEAFVVESTDLEHINQCAQRIELTVSLINLYEMRLTVENSKSNLGRLGKVVETIASMNEYDRFVPAAMALCNQLATLWQADRVSLGFLHNRSIRLNAMSHTSQFSNKMKLVQALESAMEECIDQDMELLHPAGRNATYVCRASAELSSRYGPTIVLNLPLRHQGEPIAVVTVERPWDRPFDLTEIETLRLLCDMATSRLRDMYLHDRWFGAKIADGAKEGLALIVGAKHTWVKLLAFAFVCLSLYLTFAHGTYRVESTFQLEAVKQQMVPAPFEGFIASAPVKPGDEVVAGSSVLASLNVTDMELELVDLQAKRAEYEGLASKARQENKTVDVQVNTVRMQMVDAQIGRLEERIRRANIIAPISGQVVAGDLRKNIGGPVNKGDVLFEIADMQSLRASLRVPEDRIADVAVGQRGELASASHPGEYIPFVVEQIHPIAQVIQQGNTFRVQVRLLETRPWMKPGMEGIAKIDAGEKRMAWIWSRSVMNWLRMKLWV